MNANKNKTKVGIKLVTAEIKIINLRKKVIYVTKIKQITKYVAVKLLQNQQNTSVKRLNLIKIYI